MTLLTKNKHGVGKEPRQQCSCRKLLLPSSNLFMQPQIQRQRRCQGMTMSRLSSDCLGDALQQLTGTSCCQDIILPILSQKHSILGFNAVGYSSSRGCRRWRR